MGIKWKISAATNSSVIIPIRVIKESSVMITYVRADVEREDDKPITRKKEGVVFDTHDKAKAAVIARLERHVIRLRRDVAEAEAQLLRTWDMAPRKIVDEGEKP